MIISHQKRFVFVHIYKTGGTTVTSRLLPYARFRERIAAYYLSRYPVKLLNVALGIQDRGNAWINGLHKHASAAEIKAYLGEETYRRYFSFAFVRNPYDWLVSLYHYIGQHRLHRDHGRAAAMSFEEYVRQEIASGAARQSDFITEEGQIIVDYVGSLERLGESVQEIFERIGLPHLAVEELPRENPSRRRQDFMSYYSESLREAVYDHYRRDFELFGYDY
jgi:hypothetical protein